LPTQSNQSINNYYGKYDNFTEFAEQLAHETIEGLNVNHTNSTLANYFNYEAWERDLQHDYYEGKAGDGSSLIFSCNW
jgi:antirestriction protein